MTKRTFSGTTVQNKTGTASAWTSVNPTLSKGEIGIESDTYKMKVGDGVNNWTDLPYAAQSTPNFHFLSQFVIDASAGNKTAAITAANNPFTGSGSISLTLDISTSGANGLDTGSLTASTWYYVYLCYGTSGLCCLASASSTAPTIPSGYSATYFRVGALYYGSSSVFSETIQHGNRADYVFGQSSLMMNATSAQWITTAGAMPPTAYLISLILGNATLYWNSEETWLLYSGNGYITLPRRSNTPQSLSFYVVPVSTAYCTVKGVGWIDNL